LGLDIYAGPVSRYISGDWKTVVQQIGEAQGTTVTVMRPNESGPARDAGEVAEDVSRWRSKLIRTIGLNEEWDEDMAADYYTDKPDWDGYGAVLLLAAYDEHPELKPKPQRTFLRRSKVPTVDPRQFRQTEAFKAAAQSPARYPTLLLGAEWCLPIKGGPPVFRASTPTGRETAMGHTDRLLEELNQLNQRTFKLSPKDLYALQGEPDRSPSFEEASAVGLGVLTEVAEFAAARRVTWIMDY
jgi:hypothetical protein